MTGLYIIPPADPARVLALPLGGSAPPPQGRMMPNTTVLVQDPAHPDLLWKLTPWEKAEQVMPELDIYACLGSLGVSDGLIALRGVTGTAAHLARAYDYAPHGELARFLRDARGEPRPPEPKIARSILAQIAAAMAGLHARGIVHRDLKAENVLVFKDGPTPEVRVADFDRAIVLAPGAQLDDPVGSLFHMAPELLAWQPYDHRVDIYAFGILIHEVANGGARPVPQVATGLPGAMTAEEFGAKVKAGGMRPNWQGADQELRDLANRCLAGDPGQRRAMEDALCVIDAGGHQILAVFDGLRGDRVSRFAAHSLALIVHEALSQQAPAAAIRHAFAAVQAQLCRLDPAVVSGATATVAVICPDGIDIGWTGDSPAWLVDEAASTTVTCAHHPTETTEAERVVAAGGAVARETRMMDSGEMVPWGPLRVYASESEGGIALTRALGLPSMTPVISHTPATVHHAIDHAIQFLVLTTDGVPEVLAPDRLPTLCASAASPQAAADAIIDEVLRLGSPDNASVIVMDLHRTRAGD